MESQSEDGDIVTRLVEGTLALPLENCEADLQKACGNERGLLLRAATYLQKDEPTYGSVLHASGSIASDEHPFKSGDLLDGRFLILREVARGGMGIVYEAIDGRLDRRIAVKCARQGFQNRLPPEVRNATEISHPNVCKIFEIHSAPTSEGKIDFITMEFLKGETLSERLRRSPLRGQATAIALQVCAGLAEAHRHKMVHGDLKSNNIILTTEADGTMRAVITDFGLARRPGAPASVLQSSPVGGTPAYMAPELWQGHKPSLASDVYALGVILRELAGKQASFAGPATVTDWKSPTVLRRRPRGLSLSWHRVIVRCLHPDPEKRFRDAAQVAAALAPSRSRQVFLAIAAAIMLAVVSGILAYNSGRPAQQVVRLAVLPFETDPATKPLSEGLLLDAGSRLSHVKPGRTRLTLVPLAEALQSNVDQPSRAQAMLGATHALSGILRRENGRIVVKTFLTDTRSLMQLAEWSAEYAEADLGNLPVALAGMVTRTLNLTPIAALTTVNAAGYPDYIAGSSLARRDTDIDRALPLLQRAVIADPNSPLTHAALADAQFSNYILTEDVIWKERALTSLKHAEQRNPDLAAVRFVSGRINDSEGKYGDAEADYKRAIELEGRNADAWRLLGTTYEHENRPNQAVAAYLKAIELQPDYFRNYLYLGEFYFERGEFEKAIAQYKKAVELAMDQPELHYQLATPYLSMGRYDEAERELNTAINLKELSIAVHGLGILRMLQNRDREAIPHLERALQIGPRTSALYLNLGIAYSRAALVREAEQAFQKGVGVAEAKLATNPLDAYEKGYLAYLCARLGDRGRAESEVAQALHLSRGNNDDVRWVAALTYEVLGMHERTMSVIKDAPAALLSRLNKTPELAALQGFPQFQELLKARQVQ